MRYISCLHLLLSPFHSPSMLMRHAATADAAGTMDEPPPYDAQFSILLIGDCGVGKTSLLLRFGDDTYTESYVSRVGVDFKLRTLAVGNQLVKLQWDTMRQEWFRRVQTTPYRGRHAVLCCFDLTDMVSFHNVKQWLREVDTFAHENVTVVIVGCKADLTEKREVDVEAVLEFCDGLNRSYVETSAKETLNTDEVMLQTIHDIAAARHKDVHAASASSTKHCAQRNRQVRKEELLTALLCVYYYTEAHITVLPVEVMHIIVGEAVGVLGRHGLEEVGRQVWARECVLTYEERESQPRVIILQPRRRRRKCAVC